MKSREIEKVGKINLLSNEFEVTKNNGRIWSFSRDDHISFIFHEYFNY